MAVQLESAARLAALRDKADAVTGESSATLAGAVDALIAGFGSGGGGTGGTYTDEQILELIERTGTEFTIPSGATKIGNGAFNSWLNLVNLNIPNTVTSVGENAFVGCTNLVLRELPDGIISFGVSAFANNGGCSYLDKLPSSLNEIGQYCFEYSTNLTITKIPATVTKIRNYAFRGCSGLTKIEFGSKPTEMSTNIFTYCTSLLTINVPWAEGEVAGAPWGATNATINYNYTGD